MIDATDTTSTRPYLIRALYEWCTDNGFTPYVAVLVDDMVRVPNEYVKNGEIVLNISVDATSSLKLGNEFIEFKARFAGTARDIMVPVDHVIAIYARENGQGMAFPMGVSAAPRPTDAAVSVPDDAGSDAEPKRTSLTSVVSDGGDAPTDGPRPPAGPGSRPSLTRIK